MNNPPQPEHNDTTPPNDPAPGHRADASPPPPEGGLHSERDGKLIPFPTPSPTPTPVPADGEMAPGPEVLDGELLSEEENAAFTARLAGLDRFAPRVRVLARGVAASPQAVQLRAVVGYRARQAPRDLTRLCWFALRGHGRWIAKAWTWATHADLRADARTARLTGDREARRAAQETIRSDARARWTKLGLALRRSAGAALLLVALGAVLALVDSQMDRSAMWPWLASVYTVLGITGAVLVWALKAAPLGWLVAAMWEGRDRTPGVGFLHRPDREDPDSWIDERMISQALAHLGVGPLEKFFKAGGQLVYTVAARVDGDGTYAQIRLPMGVNAEMVAAKRTTLAANLGRASLETWATKGEEDGILDLWVADKGKLGQGAGEWPLLHEGTVDVFEGVPIGRSQRGTVIMAPLFECNYLGGGKPGQGKTNFARVLALGAALDPTAELWAFVMGESSDFKPLAPRLSRYEMGMDDSVVEAAVQALADLLTEMERRGKILGQQPGSPPKTSRKLANKRELGLHWLGCWIDECHEMYQHKKYGKLAEEYSVRLIKRGRKYGISLILTTQTPTKDSIPREVTRNISCGVAFCVGDHVANDGLLGSGKYRAGIRATELRFNTDRGTCVTTGLTDTTFELLNTFYVPFEDGIDHVTPVVTRAMAEIGELRHTGRGTPTTPHDGPTQVDPLADIATVLGTEARLRTQMVLTRLAEHNPHHYEGWTFTDLKNALEEYGIAPVKSHGVMVIAADDITQALTDRDRDTDAEGEDTTGS
jgi:S-DNA-T family DNA segregation ATPase FtsK/SpoIIIE